MPRWPKIVQLTPNLMPTSANIAPKTHQDPHGDPPQVAKTYKNLRFFNVFCFYVFSSKCSPNAPQIGCKAPNMAPTSPSWVLLGASWLQGPANLAPTWPILALPGPILAPSWPFQRCRKSAQNCPKQLQDQLGAKMVPNRPQECPDASQDPSRHRFFLVFSTSFSAFWVVFSVAVFLKVP